MSSSDGCSVHDTRSVFSSLPKVQQRLAALLDLAGMIWKDPLEEVTACLNNSYCAEDTFFAKLSSSSPSENLAVFPASSWLAAKKLIGGQKVQRRIRSSVWRSWRVRRFVVWTTLWWSLKIVAPWVTICLDWSPWSSNGRAWFVWDSARTRTGWWWWWRSPDHRSWWLYSCLAGSHVWCGSLPLHHVHHGQ